MWLEDPIHKNYFSSKLYKVSDDKVEKAKLFDIESVDYLKYSFDGSIVAFKKSIFDSHLSLAKDIKMYKMGYGKFDMPKFLKTEDDLIKILLYYAEEE